MSKLIIDNQTNEPDEYILPYVLRVVLRGFISETSKGKQYCFHTKFEDVNVSVTRNKESQRFTIYKDKQ